MTDLVLETFRLNGRLLAAGDKLIKHLGLSSARWQVLGAIHLSEIPQTVAGLARSMGLTRQAVQRIANQLEKDGLLAFEHNPQHRRAKLVVFTEKGKRAYMAADREQIEWINDLCRDVSAQDIGCALKVMEDLRSRLETE